MNKVSLKTPPDAEIPSRFLEIIEMDGVTMPASGQQQLAQNVQPLRRSYGIQVNHQ